MSRTNTVSTLLIVLLVAPLAPALAGEGEELVWRLGVKDGQTAVASDGASEWRLGTGQTFMENLSVSHGDDIAMPDLAGYQLDQRLERPDGVLNDAANRLDISWDSDVDCAGAFFRYGRYGSETSQLSVLENDVSIFDRNTEGGGEEVWIEDISNTFDIVAGNSYEARLIYRDTGDQTGEDNGFYVDYVELVAPSCDVQPPSP